MMLISKRRRGSAPAMRRQMDASGGGRFGVHNCVLLC